MTVMESTMREVFEMYEAMHPYCGPYVIPAMIAMAVVDVGSEVGWLVVATRALEWPISFQE